MLQIDRTIISLDVLQTPFCCDLEACKGRCCVEGESGAPLGPEEPELMNECLEAVKPYMSEAGKAEAAHSGVCVTDADGDCVTPLVDGRECVFTFFREGKAFCAFEQAYIDEKTTFRKPISCHLYPVRITRYRDFDAVNYHRWDVCSDACRAGKEKGVPLYVFLREPLIRKYGTEWYEQLCYAATHLHLPG